MSQEVEKIDKDSPERLKKVAEFDARLTAGLLAFGRDVAIGRTTSSKWKAQRKAPDYVAALTKAADGDVKTWAGRRCVRRTRSTSRSRNRSTR